MDISEKIQELVRPIKDDLLSGAAEIALRAINIYQTIMSESSLESGEVLKQRLIQTSRILVDSQPAMAPLFHLANEVLLAMDEETGNEQIRNSVQEALNQFEKRLCESAAEIAELVYDLIPPGELVFAYSFSSTVVSCLLNARARGRFFRVVCTESRPSMEGRKLASMLVSGNIEVIHTFDSAMGLVLSNCAAAFMGCDAIGLPGIVNKVGSWVLSVSCREMKVPLYALAGTEKIVPEDRLFEFEKHERPGEEVWDAAPHGVRTLNHQFELVPFSLFTGLVTEKGVLVESGIKPHARNLKVHDALKLEVVKTF